MQKTCMHCGNEFTPRAKKNQYCSKDCANKSRDTLAPHLQYVLDSWATHTVAQMAEHLKVTERALHNKVVRWRKDGHALPSKRETSVGEVVIRIAKGKETAYRKDASGEFIRLEHIPAEATRRQDSYRKQSPKAQAQEHRMQRQQKDASRRIATRVVDLSQLIPVHIPQLRMTVHVKPGTDKQATINKYLDQRAFEKSRTGGMN